MLCNLRHGFTSIVARIIPISIQCKLNPYYRVAWREIHKVQPNITNEAIAEYIDAILDSYTRDVTLLALLEITIAKESPLRGSIILKTVIRQNRNLECLVHASEEKFANLLTTYVRAFEFNILRNPNQS